MSAPDDLDRRRHHRQARPTSHWGKDDPQPHPGPVDRCDKCQPQEGALTCEVHVPGRDRPSPWCAACRLGDPA